MRCISYGTTFRAEYFCVPTTADLGGIFGQYNALKPLPHSLTVVWAAACSKVVILVVVSLCVCGVCVGSLFLLSFIFSRESWMFTLIVSWFAGCDWGISWSYSLTF